MNWRELLSTMRDAEVGGGVSEAEIRHAEARLGVAFPPSFAEYLRQVGWLSVAHEQYYGLGQGIPTYLDVVDNAAIERHEAHPHMPLPLVPLRADGFGNHYCLDTSQRNDQGECPVVFWDHEAAAGPEQVPEVVALDFATWLTQELQNLAQEQEQAA